MTRLPVTAWSVIAQYLPAQPVLFIRLATLSRSLYEVFMSDKVWKRVDVYNIGENISRHYLATIYASKPNELKFKRLMYKHWTDGSIELSKYTDWYRHEWLERVLYDSYSYFTNERFLNMKNFYKEKMPPYSPLNEVVVAQCGRTDLIGDAHFSKRSIKLLAVSRKGMNLEQIPKETRDREMVMAAVSNNGMALKFANDTEKGDPEIVLAAVFQNGLAIQFARGFRDVETPEARQIMETAIRNNLHSFTLMDHEVQRDPDIGSLVRGIGQKLSGIRQERCSFRIVKN